MPFLTVFASLQTPFLLIIPDKLLVSLVTIFYRGFAMNVSATHDLANLAQLVKNCTERFAALPAHVQWDIYGTLRPNHYICENKSQLMAYNALFANQHFAKLIDLFDFVFGRFIKLEQITALQNTTNPISVIDYGCGQGLASITLQEFNRERQLGYQFEEVILIEPSALALKEAVKHNALHYTHIKPQCSKFDKLTANDLLTQHHVTVHLLSNVLDLPNIDVNALASCIKQSLSGINIFVCCSPNYTNAIKGIDQFCDYFDDDVENVYYNKTYCDVESFEMRSQCIRQYQVPRYAKMFVIQ